MQTTELKIRGIYFRIGYYFSKAEPMVYRDNNGDGYDGYPSEVEIVEIKYRNDDFLEFFEPEILEIENELLDAIENGRI